MASDDDVIYLSDDEENQREVDRKKAEDKKTVEDFQKNHPDDFKKVREVFDKVFQYLNEDPIVKKILKALVPGVPYDLVGLCFAHFRTEILDGLMPDDVMSQPRQMGWLHMTYNRQPEISTIKFSHAFKACQIEEGDIEEYYKFRNGIDKRDGIKRHAGVLMNPIVRVIPKPKDVRNKGTQWEPEDEDQGDCQVVEPAGPKRGKIRPSQCQAPTQPGSLDQWISRNQRGATPDEDGEDAESPVEPSSRPLSQEDRHRMSGGTATSPVVPMSARSNTASRRSTGVSLINSATRPRSASPSTAPSSLLAPRRRSTSSDVPAINQGGRRTQGFPATPAADQRASRRRSPQRRSTAPVAPRRRLRSSDPPATTLRSGRSFRENDGSLAKPAAQQRVSRRRSSSRDAQASPAPSRRRFRSADAPAINQQGRGIQRCPGHSPALHLVTPPDAPKTIQQSGRSFGGNQGIPVKPVANQRAARRRSSSGDAQSNPVPPRRRTTSESNAPQLSPVGPTQPSSSDAAQKSKTTRRKRPAPYKAFGCPRRKKSQNPGKQSSGPAPPSTTVVSAGSDGRGRGAGATTEAPSGRGRGKSPATNAPPMSRKRATVVSPNTAGAPQPKKRNTVI
ncbi:hypothetical protein B9Z55_007563 [Caenorhabditis nigoni]|uniref:Uncharacterized protein n=1 Tax=Caenorhabditis nigoni TaxID=1611254 RepID=A0A2G5VA77_9PELO|nr:hypothetical protein B9Z55_007563 [Caenorhabditis nigoni]